MPEFEELVSIFAPVNVVQLKATDVKMTLTLDGLTDHVLKEIAKEQEVPKIKVCSAIIQHYILKWKADQEPEINFDLDNDIYKENKALRRRIDLLQKCSNKWRTKFRNLNEKLNNVSD